MRLGKYESSEDSHAGTAVTFLLIGLGAGALAGGRERLVVMASKASADLASVWKAGVRHVVFHGDHPRTVRVAVLATELSLTAPDL